MTLVLNTIAKDSGISLNKAKIAANALCAGINSCLEQGVFSLDTDTDNHGWMAEHAFMLANHAALVRAFDIGHQELSLVLVVPAEGYVHTPGTLNMFATLAHGFDLVCGGWLERKTGKFLQGRLTCRARREPWISDLADLAISPAGYDVSKEFFM